jgi:DNA-binding response OmpR family regulator
VWQPRILVVEDYFGVRDFLSAVLSREGAVETAGNGKEALDKVQNQYFDIIISDVDMPVMDGLRFFTEASRLSPGIGARFLFLTGNPSEETLEFIGKNRLRYLQKPMQIQELMSEVGALLDRSSQLTIGRMKA